jgi:hypothetical protein
LQLEVVVVVVVRVTKLHVLHQEVEEDLQLAL